jgi:anti-sigma regulatory factor (Ser/Thr protein kinase)
VTSIATAQANERPRAHTGRSAWVNVVIVVVAGVVLTVAAVAGTRRVHDNNERRLLDERVAQVVTVLSGAIPNTRTPLASAAAIADATGGDPTAFTRFVAPVLAEGQPFVGLSLWRREPGGAVLVTRAGTALRLEHLPAGRAQAYLAGVGGRDFSVLNLLGGGTRRLGYGFATGRRAEYVVYGEASLPRGRRARVATNSAFADLDYAVFLGAHPRASQLLASSTGRASLAGRTESATVPFGDRRLLIQLSPRTELGGTLLAWLAWIVGFFGLLVTAVAALTVWRLSRRRVRAENLAEENERLYSDQRSVAQTLQHSLLPQALPEVQGLEFGAIYAPGAEGIDIGGDWYEVLTRPDGQVIVVVGDVSGHGLDAATTMAALRFAIRAYATEGDGPGAVLRKLTRLGNIGRDGHFATVLCGAIDPRARTATWANAGHPRPLLVADGATRYLTVPVGPPVGVTVDAEYGEETHVLPTAGTLLLYTDGLIERRQESIDIGFERLAAAARGIGDGPLADALFSIVRQAIPEGCDDDAAVLGIRWGHDGPGGSASFPASPTSVIQARDYVTDALDGVAPDIVQNVVLMVSELATNSLRHAAAGFTLDVDCAPDRIRVAVSDPGPGSPEVRIPSPVEASGRGLQIVETLSDEWGYAPAPDGVGKTVWFAVAVDGVRA